jgi:hypothetical protein
MGQKSASLRGDYGARKTTAASLRQAALRAQADRQSGNAKGCAGNDCFSP